MALLLILAISAMEIYTSILLHFLKVTEGKAAEIADFLQNKEETIRGLINDAVVLYDGSITAEHGIGRLRKSENVRLKSDVELEMMRGIKYSLDPKNILNPEILF